MSFKEGGTLSNYVLTFSKGEAELVLFAEQYQGAQKTVDLKSINISFQPGAPIPEGRRTVICVTNLGKTHLPRENGAVDAVWHPLKILAVDAQLLYSFSQPSPVLITEAPPVIKFQLVDSKERKICKDLNGVALLTMANVQ